MIPISVQYTVKDSKVSPHDQSWGSSPGAAYMGKHSRTGGSGLGFGNPDPGKPKLTPKKGKKENGPLTGFQKTYMIPGFSNSLDLHPDSKVNPDPTQW